MTVRSYFERLGADRYRATELTSGAWSVTEQHISALNGLAVHAVEQFVAAAPDDGKVISRITFEILGPVAIDELDIRVERIRPGRAVELLEATVTCRDRAVLRATVWRSETSDTTAVTGGQPEPLPGPRTIPPWEMQSLWPGAFITTLDVRPVREPEPGRTTAWIATDTPLLADEPISELARFVGLVDVANGIAARQAPTQWLFPNLDLTIHLYRQPVGRWVGLDTSVIFGPTGQGLTSSVLHDETGPVGRAQQVLMVRRLD